MLGPARSGDRAAIGDDHLRGVPALRFPDVPAVAHCCEFRAQALPAGAGVEDDVMAIDQVFASSVDFRSHRLPDQRQLQRKGRSLLRSRAHG
jgi:hypothetical protein